MPYFFQEPNTQKAAMQIHPLVMTAESAENKT
jgi:hypothetical protein